MFHIKHCHLHQNIYNSQMKNTEINLTWKVTPANNTFAQYNYIICEIWQIYHNALARFIDLPALVCTSNLHEPHQNKNHSLIEWTW